MAAAETTIEQLSGEHEQALANLDKALALTDNIQAAYDLAPPAVRRLFNQSFFEQLLVIDGDIAGRVLAEPFKQLLDSDLRAALEASLRIPAWLQQESERIPAQTGGGQNDRTPGPLWTEGSISDEMVGFLGALSNLENQERLERLAEKLDRIAGSDAPPRATPLEPRRRCGEVSKAVMEILRDCGEPLQMVEIHAAVEALLGDTVPRSTIKNCLVNNSKGARACLVRLGRGRYSSAPVEL